jgi:hypothetical protein
MRLLREQRKVTSWQVLQSTSQASHFDHLANVYFDHLANVYNTISHLHLLLRFADNASSSKNHAHSIIFDKSIFYLEMSCAWFLAGLTRAAIPRTTPSMIEKAVILCVPS